VITFNFGQERKAPEDTDILRLLRALRSCPKLKVITLRKPCSLAPVQKSCPRSYIIWIVITFNFGQERKAPEDTDILRLLRENGLNGKANT
jgi:sulfur carrier protein ThiS